MRRGSDLKLSSDRSAWTSFCWEVPQLESVRAGKGEVGPSYGPPAYVILEVSKGLTTRATVILHGKELP